MHFLVVVACKALSPLGVNSPDTSSNYDTREEEAGRDPHAVSYNREEEPDERKSNKLITLIFVHLLLHEKTSDGSSLGVEEKCG